MSWVIARWPERKRRQELVADLGELRGFEVDGIGNVGEDDERTRVHLACRCGGDAGRSEPSPTHIGQRLIYWPNIGHDWRWWGGMPCHVERATIKHIEGYYVAVDELDRNGNVKTMRKWVPQRHAGSNGSRRPQVYREQKDVKHLNLDDAFLRTDEEQKLPIERARLIENQPAPVVEDVKASSDDR